MPDMTWEAALHLAFAGACLGFGWHASKTVWKLLWLMVIGDDT